MTGACGGGHVPEVCTTACPIGRELRASYPQPVGPPLRGRAYHGVFLVSEDCAAAQAGDGDLGQRVGGVRAERAHAEPVPASGECGKCDGANVPEH
jgi:hypothetical protein